MRGVRKEGRRGDARLESPDEREREDARPLRACEKRTERLDARSTEREREREREREMRTRACAEREREMKARWDDLGAISTR